MKGFIPPKITKDDIRKAFQNDPQFQQILGIKPAPDFKKQNADCKLINLYIPEYIRHIGKLGLKTLNSKQLETAFTLNIIRDITTEINLHKDYPALFSPKLTKKYAFTLLDKYNFKITDYDDDYRITYDFLEFITDSLKH